MMTDRQLLAKVEANEGLTVDEIKRYQKLVKPQKHVYGKWGTLKRKYLEDKGIDWTIENLPEYLHGVDRQAEDMFTRRKQYENAESRNRQEIRGQAQRGTQGGTRSVGNLYEP